MHSRAQRDPVTRASKGPLNCAKPQPTHKMQFLDVNFRKTQNKLIYMRNCRGCRASTIRILKGIN